MAAGSWTFYNDGKLRLQNNAYNFVSDTIKCILATSSYTPDAEAHSVLADITNEVSGGNYARITLASKSITRSGGTVTVTSANIQQASNSTITAKYAILYDDTHASDGLIAYVDLNTGGGSVSSTASSFDIVISGSGLWTVS